MSFDEKLFEDNFTFGFKANVANNFIVATKAFEDFWRSNSVFLRNADDLYGRLLYYAVNQQFKNTSINTASTYLVTDSIVTTYKNKAVFLNTDNYVASICRTDKPNKLPSKANYKMELAKGNQSENNQYEFNFNKKELSIGEMKRYAIIGYRYIGGEMRHLNIVVPDSDFESILHYENILQNIIEFQEYIPEELINEQVTGLKNDILVKLEREKIL